MSLALVFVLPHGQRRQGAHQAGVGERTGQTSSDNHKNPRNCSWNNLSEVVAVKVLNVTGA